MIDKANQPTTAEIATDYHSRGWAVISIARGTKIPPGVAWQETTVDDFKPTKFSGRKNLGVVLGQNSNWLIDIDLDHQLAVDLADRFLPPTDSVFGRAGKPRSHRLYRVTQPIDTHKRRLPAGKNGDKKKLKDKMIVELRSSGCQTVFPGSLHTSGESIEWDSDGTPAEIDPDALRAAVDALADEVEAVLGIVKPETTITSSNGAAGAARAVAPLPADAAERARRYIAKMEPAISGSGGHDATFKVACRLVIGFGLDRETAFGILRDDFNPRCEPPWSEKELLHKVDSAMNEPGERGTFLLSETASKPPRSTNQEPANAAPAVDANRAVATVADSIVANAVKTSGENAEILPIPADQIIERLHKRTGNWPRYANGLLFVDEPNGLLTLEKTNDLFAYFHRAVGGVSWHKSPWCIDKGEFHSTLKQSVPRYLAIEDAPHFPSIDGHYYRRRDIKAGDGSALNELLDRFCPATPIDRDLLLAFVATIFWGGPPGKRPGFAITAEHGGRGVGKSTVPMVFGALAGGCFDFSLGEDITQIKQRLLTPDALTKRVVLLDNIKTSKMSWAEVESMITAPEISGKRMYAGEATRPNVLTWVLTLNGISLAKDLAQRFIVTKLAKWKTHPVPEGESVPAWDEETAQLLAERRWDIIGDIKAFFEREPVKLRDCSRWGAWERAVLARLPEPEEAQRVIEERQGEVDADDEEASDIEEFIAKKLSDYGYDPVRDRVHIPVLTATAWYETVTNTKVGKTQATRVLKQAAEEEIFKRLRLNPSRAKGRGFLWIGDEARGEAHYDLESKIKTAELDADAEKWASRRNWGYNPS
jgi:hypothetical protein